MSAPVVTPPEPERTTGWDGPDTGGRRRRPTGAPPPLPRKIGTSGAVWLVALVTVLVWCATAFALEPVRRLTDRVDAAILDQLARRRSEWLSDVATPIDRIGSGWTLTIVAVGTLVGVLCFRRWRHLFTWLACIAVLELAGSALYDAFSRPRPQGVTVIGRWNGFSMPSPPVGVLAAVLIGVAYTLVVPGRARTLAKWTIASALLLFVGSRLYLGVDHPSDAMVGIILGVAIPLLAFRVFTPNEVFPVAYRRGKTAHLDVGGSRGEAIRRAVRDQLGRTVTEIKPVGLEGSGGSTPLRLRVEGGSSRYLFAKLYAMNHVRADRWYKLGRTILYGRLEDESAYQSVRRLVEYEDYAARLLRDVGIPTAESCGIVELTPEREYMLVTEFLDGATEIGDADVDDDIIDEGLVLVRQLWDAGLAHRDIKPANLLVRDGHVFMIDVAFVQVRPSPWRQAVDLANIMLVLAVRTDAERVYDRARHYFTPDEIAEAFAAARGIASPTQLRVAMKQDGRDLIADFRRLAPERRPIALQRWSIRRFVLAFVLVGVTLPTLGLITEMLSPVNDLPISGSPECGTGDLMVLIAQSVPSATAVPCIATLPAGWELDDVHVRRGRTRFWLNSDRAGHQALEVTLTGADSCDVSDAEAVPSDEAGFRRFESPERVTGGLRGTRTYLFPGGCVTYRLSFVEDATPASIFEADQAVSFEPRANLVAEVRRDTDLDLCGADVPCPGGTGS